MRAIKFAAALVAALSLSGCGFSLQNAPVGKSVDGDSYKLTAEFVDVAGLPLGGKVRLGPATVGRVESFEAKDFVAVVTLDMRSDVKLPKGTKAGLELSTALGDQFIALKVPKGSTGPYLREGDRIPLTDTIRGPDIEDNMALLGNVLNNSGLEQARVIVTEMNTMLDGRQDKARALLGRADEVLASLDKRTDEFNSTLRAVDKLGRTINANQAVLEQAMKEIAPALDVLRGQQGNFNTLLDGVGRLSADVGTAMRKTKTQLVSTLTKIGPVLDDLAGVDRDLGVLTAKLPRFSALMQRAIPGDYMNLHGVINVQDSIPGVLAPGGGSGAAGRSTLDEPVSGSRAVGALLRGGTR